MAETWPCYYWIDGFQAQLHYPKTDEILTYPFSYLFKILNISLKINPENLIQDLYPLFIKSLKLYSNSYLIFSYTNSIKFQVSNIFFLSMINKVERCQQQCKQWSTSHLLVCLLWDKYHTVTLDYLLDIFVSLINDEEECVTCVQLVLFVIIYRHIYFQSCFGFSSWNSLLKNFNCNLHYIKWIE